MSSVATTKSPAGPSTSNKKARQADENHKLKSAQAKAEQVADVARQNIQMSLKQVDRLQDMEEKAKKLENTSSDFHKGAKKVKSKMCLESYKLLCMMFLVLALLGAVVYFSIFGTGSLTSSSSSSTTPATP